MCPAPVQYIGLAAPVLNAETLGRYAGVAAVARGWLLLLPQAL